MSDADERSLELVAELQRQFACWRNRVPRPKASPRLQPHATGRSRSRPTLPATSSTWTSSPAHSTGRPLGAAITVCANQALQAAQEAAEKRMAEFFEAQTAVLGDLTARTGVDVADTVRRESRPPAIPDHLLTEEAFRRSRGWPRSVLRWARLLLCSSWFRHASRLAGCCEMRSDLFAFPACRVAASRRVWGIMYWWPKDIVR